MRSDASGPRGHDERWLCTIVSVACCIGVASVLFAGGSHSHEAESSSVPVQLSLVTVGTVASAPVRPSSPSYVPDDAAHSPSAHSMPPLQFMDTVGSAHHIPSRPALPPAGASTPLASASGTSTCSRRPTATSSMPAIHISTASATCSTASPSREVRPASRSHTATSTRTETDTHTQRASVAPSRSLRSRTRTVTATAVSRKRSRSPSPLQSAASSPSQSRQSVTHSRPASKRVRYSSTATPSPSFLQHTDVCNVTRPLRILFIGDSVDRNTLMYGCLEYKAMTGRSKEPEEVATADDLTIESIGLDAEGAAYIQTPLNTRTADILQRAAPWWQLWDVHTCTFWSDELQRRVILGFHHHKPGVAGGYGPYHFDTRAVGAAAGFEWRDSELPDELFMRLSKPATGVVVDIMGGMPDAVSINSAFWDLARVRLAYPHVWEDGWQDLDSGDYDATFATRAQSTRSEWIESYGRNVSLHIRGVKRALSAVASERGLRDEVPLIAWRTANRYWVTWEHLAATTLEWETRWQRLRLLEGMNVRAEAARSEGLEILDMFRFPDPGMYEVHPQSPTMLRWLTYVMNRALEAGRCHQRLDNEWTKPAPGMQ